MFFQTNIPDARILSVIEMGWQRVNAHAGPRPFHTLSYRLVGGATFLDGDRELLRVEEDEIIFVPADFDFTKQAGTGRIIAIHFLSDAPLPKALLRFSPKDSRYFRRKFTDLQRLWTEKRFGYQYEAKILLYQIILDMERQWEDTVNTPARQKLSAALEYISKHLSDCNLSVDALSKLCSMSDTYFRRLFVQEFGMTPQRYISRLRLEMATELLRSGYYSVSAIAERCGFNNPNYFSMFIKKETGLSPLQYRKQLLSPEPAKAEVNKR